MNYFNWEQIWLPAECERANVDVLHCPFNFGLPARSPCPRVLTLHDCIDQIYYRPQQTVWEKLRIDALKMELLQWIARNRAEHVITVSQHAKDDLVRYLSISPEKISVIYEAADPLFHQLIGPEVRARVRATHGIDGPYIFYVGGWERRKNIPFLLDAFTQAALGPVQLVLAGGQSDQIAAVSEIAEELGIGSRVRTLGWVEDQDLPALYAESLCFVYPSEYEGFGLQLCEAMAVGCPVFAARRASLPEILGQGGETFSLEDPAELTGLIQCVAADLGYRKQLAGRAVARSLDFSWRSAAEKTLVVYTQ